jgi:hypothetical protein
VRLRLPVLTAALAVLVPATLVATTPASSGAVSVPGCPAVSLTRTGPQSSELRKTATDATWDLRGASWDEPSSDGAYPVRSDSWTRGCIVGPRVHGNVPKSWTREQWYNGTLQRRGGEAFRQTLTGTSGNYLVIRDAYAEDFEDAFDPNGTSTAHTMYLDHVQAKDIRDDCIEDEGAGAPEVPMSVVVRNSFFDGCFTGFAMRPPGAGGAVQNGSGAQSLTVDGSLMRITPQPLGSTYCSNAKVTSGRCRATSDPSVWLGAHGIWKWSKAAARSVTIRNSVFRLDLASYSSCSPQQWPAGTYDNVTVVWAGPGSYASAGGCKNVLPAGVRLTTDLKVWDDAVAAWKAGGPAAGGTSASTGTTTTGTTTTGTTSSRAARTVSTRLSAAVRRHTVLGTLRTASGARVSGAPVVLQRKATAGSRWVPTLHRRTSGAGTVGVAVRAVRSGSYRWTFPGRPGRYAATHSGPVRVHR